MRRGDVYWAELQPRSGSEQRGTRPVIVVSHDAFNEAARWRSVIVIPCSTSETQGRRGPTAVALASGAGGLKAAGLALCHQVTTLDRSKLTKKIGRLSEAEMQAVEAGILVALDLVR